VTVVWTEYEPFDAAIVEPLRNVAREIADDHFRRLMDARATRHQHLAALVLRNAHIELDAASPEALGTWLMAALHDAGPAALVGVDAALWTGLVADVALWLGERIIRQAAELERAGGVRPQVGALGAPGPVRWEVLTAPKKATGYHRPVLVGFIRVPDPRYYVDVAHLVASWADLASRRRPQVRPDFLATIERTTLADA
jgi:hypothetical protein